MTDKHTDTKKDIHWLLQDHRVIRRYPSKKIKWILGGIFAILSFHIIWTTSYPILPIICLWFIMVMLYVVPHTLYYCLRFPTYTIPNNSGAFIYIIPLYVIRIIFFMCLIMVVIYEITGWYIDISDSYNILHIFPHIWDYTGSDITDKPYDLANTILIILYYSGVYIVIPLVWIIPTILSIQACRDLKKALQIQNPTMINRLKIYVKYIKNEMLINPESLRFRVTSFLIVLGLLGFIIMTLNSTDIAFEEGFSPWVGTVNLTYGAYYILFNIMGYFIGVVYLPILVISGLYTNILFYYLNRYSNILNEGDENVK